MNPTPVFWCIAGQGFALPELWFVFQQTKFVFTDAGGKQGFVRMEYPSEGSLEAYLGCRGWGNKAAQAAAAERWGPNVLDIPMPAFMTLFAEHAVAPFFVFQILCVALWSLDDYWYYALFTLVMLVLFEAMLCLQRQKNLEMLRSMRREPTLVYVLRAGRWQRVSSEAVTPGEVVSLVARPPTVANAVREMQQRAMRNRHRAGRQQGSGFPRGVGGAAGTGLGMDQIMSSGDYGLPGGGGTMVGDEEALAPFDVLLMRGSCVVNEAMLTGESVPQAKTSLLSAGGAAGGGSWVKVEDGTDSPHRKHVIFSGTKVLQYAADDDDGGAVEGPGSDLAGLTPPPDKGCPCVVLRTGFETSQGQLMKTILFATKRVAAGSDWETGVFILILLVFAAVASAFVLAEGLADKTRNPFKLVLHCIMILTSVIPPELPIELSLAVMNSLTALTQSLIFCTEPFRIPLAGKVDVCCFDKTGTLTSDNLVMKGVAGAPLPPSERGARGGDATVESTLAKNPPAAATAAGDPATVTVPVAELGEVPTRILAGCHSLVTLNGSLVGDSVEVATLKGLGWACLRGGLVAPRASAKAAREAWRAASGSGTPAEGGSGSGSGGGGSVSGGNGSGDSTAAAAAAADGALQPLQVVHSWAFDPSLRRMCTAVRLAEGAHSGSGGQAGQQQQRAGAPAAAAAGGGPAQEKGGVPPFHDRLWVVAKGAPESLEPLLSDAPPNYRSTFLHHMGQGSRVLALAYRALEPRVDLATCRRMRRSSAERGLRFGGFLVLGCPLKPDAPYVVRELRESSHSVCMITGDGALTAADVARQVGMIDQPPSRTLVLSRTPAGGGGERVAAAESLSAEAAGGSPDASSLCWVSLAAGGAPSGGGGRVPFDAGGGGVPFDAPGIAALAERHALCVTGDMLSQVSAVTGAGGAGVDFTAAPETPSSSTKKGLKLPSSSSSSDDLPAKAAAAHSSALSALCSHATVFARVSPAQKELIIGELNASGHTTVMCGDGTNDVGALRRAHVGNVMWISIVNSPELERRLEAFLGDGQQQQQRRRKKGTEETAGSTSSTSGRRGKKSQAKQSRLLASREIEEQEKDPALVKLGDASIASPFTAKTTSVGCVLAVIRQGRCTLVTTLQVYKILALNCLTSAYMLSALYLKGVKQGDGQMTALGLAVSALFYFASRSHPLRRLSTARPPARILCLPACLSVLGQFAAHLASLLVVTRLCEGHVNPEDPSVMPDGPFRANTFNSAVFLLSAVMQVNTFAANYTGHPFMQSLGENRAMCYLVLACYATLLVAASGLAPSLESWLQLAPFPAGFRGPLLAVLAADTALVFAVEYGTRWYAGGFGGGGAGVVVAAAGSGKTSGGRNKSRKRTKRPIG
ncbi:unnamed protein product [Ectocarpus sp. CCAP 1310/34]|nr:unnamed protein product [Ectocarpus sp. CCAP 1310/34]